MSENMENEVRGTLTGSKYDSVRQAFDRQKALREALGKDVKEMNLSEFVIALAAVTASSLGR